MRRTMLALVSMAALSSPACAAPPETAQGWRDAAAQDLNAIHDTLRDNSPAMVVTRDGAHFRRWLDEGLRQARPALAGVTDGRGYYFIIERYVVGFRDAHILFEPTRASGIHLRALAWPGFALRSGGGGYEVAVRAPDATDAPPLGARLIGCDGKSAEALVQQRDLYDGNLKLAAARAAGAAQFLEDRGNPFVARPNRCTFRAHGVDHAYGLQWRALDDASAGKITTPSANRPAPKLGLEPWGEQRWWLTVPSMDDDQDWTGFYAQIKSHLDAIRAADAVVIDLRTNNGGSSEFGDRLARLLWGEALVDARQPHLGPTVWRASKLNRDYWANAAKTISQNPQFSEATKAEVRRILASYDAALAHGDATFELGEDARAKAPQSAPDPLHGRVILLTDSACSSACLDLMDEFTAMPNVAQAGSATSADTIFMELSIVPALPSGLGAFGFGHKAWIDRPRGSNVAYVPSPRLTWSGDDNDEAGLRAWLDGELARR